MTDIRRYLFGLSIYRRWDLELLQKAAESRMIPLCRTVLPIADYGDIFEDSSAMRKFVT
jgi:hypothetical protein